jgi:hypothetical protein
MQHRLSFLIDTTSDTLRVPDGFGAIDWATVGLNLHEISRLIAHGVKNGQLGYAGKPVMAWKVEQVPFGAE